MLEKPPPPLCEHLPGLTEEKRKKEGRDENGKKEQKQRNNGTIQRRLPTWIQLGEFDTHNKTAIRNPRGGVLILPQGRPHWGGIKSGADNPSTAHTIQRGDQTGVPYGFSVKPEIQHVKRGWQDPHFS